MGFSWTTRRERVHLHNSELQGTIQGRKERRFARIAWIELKKKRCALQFLFAVHYEVFHEREKLFLSYFRFRAKISIK